VVIHSDAALANGLSDAGSTVHGMTKSQLEKAIDALPFPIPSGILTWPEPDSGYYVSDGPAPEGLWTLLREQHPRTGLWPVYLQGHEKDPHYPWLSDESGYSCTEPPQPGQAAAVLHRQWDQLAEISMLVPRLKTRFAQRTAPFNGAWSGLAPRFPPLTDPDAAADELAGRLLQDSDTRLGLMLVDRGADVPMVAEWWASDQIDTGSAAAVLRSWEDRFGIRLVQFGFDSLELSVAAPPTTSTEAQHLAAEHFALCPENVGYESGALARYAEELIGAQQWSFWWERQVPDWLEED
jgi:hypothetical protein